MKDASFLTGYALVSGKFKVQNSRKERCNILAGVPNFYDKDNGNLGKASIFFLIIKTFRHIVFKTSFYVIRYVG